MSSSNARPPQEVTPMISNWFHASKIVEEGENPEVIIAELGQWLVGHLIDAGYTDSAAPPFLTEQAKATGIRQTKESFRGWEYRGSLASRKIGEKWEQVATADALGIK